MADTHGSALPLHRAVIVIGAGTMGGGIAEVAATAGHRVLLRDADAESLARGIARIRAGLDKRVARGKIDAAARDAIVSRIHADDGSADTADVGLVIEAIVENLDIKVAALTPYADSLPVDAILATNTSSLSVTALAARLPEPARVAGLHFFNPATVLPLVEVVAGQATSPEVVETLVATARAWKKAPVVCSSTPGFIVNRIARPFYGETLRLLQECAATPATLDAVLRESGGFRMGPCELMDLIGHDVNFAVTCSVYDAFFQDPRYRPSLVQQALVDAGWLGRKSGRGFFDYREGAGAPQPEDATGARPLQVRVEGDLGAAQALVALLDGHDGITVEHGNGPGLLRVDGLALALTDGRTATGRSFDAGEPVAVFDLALDYATATRIAVAFPAHADAQKRDAVIGLFEALGKRVSALDDAPGLVVARTVAMLVNEAADALQQDIASADDIDAAMTRGVNYPLGPLAWGRKDGLPYFAAVLTHLAAAYGEDRYRVSPWLRREVQAQHIGAGTHG